MLHKTYPDNQKNRDLKKMAKEATLLFPHIIPLILPQT
jgi:hypothetical protein